MSLPNLPTTSNKQLSRWCFCIFTALSCSGAPAPAQYGNYDPPSGYGSYDASYGGPPGQRPIMPPGQTQGAPQISQWFAQFDQIRRQAQMSPQERQQADYFLSKITAVFVPGQEKLEAKNLLTRMVSRYRQASIALKQLPVIPETASLHKGYYRYFVTAGNLFIDYLKVQDNLLVADPQTGQPIAARLMQRKQALEELNQSVLALDRQVRDKLGVPAYHYQ